MAVQEMQAERDAAAWNRMTKSSAGKYTSTTCAQVLSDVLSDLTQSLCTGRIGTELGEFK